MRKAALAPEHHPRIQTGWLSQTKYGIMMSGRSLMSRQGNIDWSDCTLVEAKPGVLSGAPVLRGTRMPVEAIVDNFDYGVSVAEIAEQFEIPQKSVEAILTYAKSHRIAHRI